MAQGVRWLVLTNLSVGLSWRWRMVGPIVLVVFHFAKELLSRSGINVAMYSTLRGGTQLYFDTVSREDVICNLSTLLQLTWAESHALENL